MKELMDLIDAYAEARHTHGSSAYNAKTAAARKAVTAVVEAMCARIYDLTVHVGELSNTNLELSVAPSIMKAQQQIASPAARAAVMAAAGEVVAALDSDREDGGYDLEAGMFGPAFSEIVRKLARVNRREARLTEPLARVREKLVAAQNCHPVAVQVLISEALVALAAVTGEPS